MNIENVEVIHNAEKKRFEAHLGDDIAVLEYMGAPNMIIFTHTEVPPAYEGRGIGDKLARVALEHAQSVGWTIQPMCPFVAAYIRKHPEYQALVFGHHR